MAAMFTVGPTARFTVVLLFVQNSVLFLLMFIKVIFLFHLYHGNIFSQLPLFCLFSQLSLSQFSFE